MNFRMLTAGAVGALALFSAGAADAALVFVDSWRLTDGPATDKPLSAQEAAARLFGGDASDYVISTAGSAVAKINHQAWYVNFDFPGFAVIDGEGATQDSFGSGLSAYAFDADVASEADRFINYAFRDEPDPGPGIPEPATWALMIGGFGITGAALRRRRAFA